MPKVNAQLKNRDLLIQEVKFQLSKAQERMKMNYDRKRREMEFKEVELVYVCFQPYDQHSIFSRTNLNLAPKFASPYKILKKINAVVYKLSLPVVAHVHDTFHIPMLKQVLGLTDEESKEPISY